MEETTIEDRTNTDNAQVTGQFPVYYTVWHVPPVERIEHEIIWCA